MKTDYNRGDVWLVNLDPTVGREIQKTRPCVIVSPPEMNRHLQTVIAAPMTTGNRPAPFRPDVHFQGKDGLIVLDHIRSADKSRLLKRLGAIDSQTLSAVLTALTDLFAE